MRSRWVDINKGDDKKRNYRSRVVAQEFNDGSQMVEDLFAGTPPLEAVKMLLSEASTVEEADVGTRVVIVADVKKTFYEALAKRRICMEVPEEDKSDEDKTQDVVGELMLAMPGTRDAANSWQEEVARWAKGLGFERGKWNPCIYWHVRKNIQMLIHGDDFMMVCGRDVIGFVKGELAKRFTAKIEVCGHEEGESKEVTILNRVIRAVDDGWEYEADQRHAEMMIGELGLKEASGVGAPGEDEKKWEREENEEELNKEEATAFRSTAARGNYLGSDRVDIQYAVKEVCRGMAKPTKGDQKKMKRLGRYIVKCPRLVWKFQWQGRKHEIEVFTDSDWAGCPKTRKSTSGGVIMIGTHVLKTWSRTQKTVALSSGEAEMIAVVKGVSEGLGMKSLAADWGREYKLLGMCDSSAAIGIIGRKGVGKIRHLDVGMMWVQDLRESGGFEVKKVPGTMNPADQLTKYLGAGDVGKGVEMLGMEFRGGRAERGVEVVEGWRSKQ